jgi:hypothetical protein
VHCVWSVDIQATCDYVRRLTGRHRSRGALSSALARSSPQEFDGTDRRVSWTTVKALRPPTAGTVRPFALEFIFVPFDVDTADVSAFLSWAAASCGWVGGRRGPLQTAHGTRVVGQARAVPDGSPETSRRAKVIIADRQSDRRSASYLSQANAASYRTDPSVCRHATAPLLTLADRGHLGARRW